MCANDQVSHTVVEVDGQPVTCVVGGSLFNALVNAGRVIPSACGGSGVCGLCRVRVAADTVLPPPTAAEARALGAAAMARGERLSCRLLVTAPLRVALLPW